MLNSLQYSHHLVKSCIEPGDKVVDATAGNGLDTLLLAELVGPKGTVYSYDIQSIAIEKTRQRLNNAGYLQRVKLIHRGHETMEGDLAPDNYIKVAMFNLGYLPGGDHTLVTQPKATLQAIKICMDYLLPRGIITIVTYYGHPGGSEELVSLATHLSSLDQRRFDILKYEYINQQNQPPILFAIQKKRLKHEP